MASTLNTTSPKKSCRIRCEAPSKQEYSQTLLPSGTCCTLNREFYLKDDVVELSRKLLGKFLFTDFGEGKTGGMIIETEAYRGPDDRASHAYQNKKTERNRVMFETGGICYVYCCYGIHMLFNVVTGLKDIPHGVLIRAIHPTEGLELMKKRRKKRNLTDGPANVTQALGIKKNHNGSSLQAPPIWIEDRGIQLKKTEILATSRIGIDYAGEDAKLPWRFIFKVHP